MEPAKRSNRDILREKSEAWIEAVIRTDEFRKFKRDSIAWAIYSDDPEHVRPEELQVFEFPPDITLQHNLIMAYLSLLSNLEGLRQMEYYFRRYPFSGTPIARTDHIRNMCEMYFNHFYMFRERLKVVLNSLNEAIDPRKVDVGGFIKSYDKEFDQELRERHGVHHRSSFEDLAIDRIHLTEVLAMGSDSARKRWHKEHLSAYRKMSREWAERARKRSAAVDRFAEAVAGAILACDFLDPPAQAS